MLGRITRQHLLELPFSARISRVDRALQRLESDMLVSQLTGTAAAAVRPAVPLPAEPAQTAAAVAAPSEPTAPSPDSAAAVAAEAEAEAYLALRQIVREVVGTNEVEESSIADVVALARSGLAVLANQQDVRARLDSLQSAVEALEDALLQVELEDARLDQAAQLEAATRLEDQVRYLQRALERSGQGELAWSEVPAEARTGPPVRRAVRTRRRAAACRRHSQRWASAGAGRARLPRHLRS
jgi:hypothetical protein